MLGWGDNGDPKNLNKDMDVLQEVRCDGSMCQQDAPCGGQRTRGVRARRCIARLPAGGRPSTTLPPFYAPVLREQVFFREQPYLTCQQFYQMPGTSNFFTNTLMCAGE